MLRGLTAVLATGLAVVLVLVFLFRVADVLLLLFVAALFSLYLRAVGDELERRARVPRPVGLAAAVALTAFGVAAVGWLIVPPLVQQTEELIRALPVLFERWEAELLALAEDSPVAAHVLGPPREGESYVGLVVQHVGSYFADLVPLFVSGLHVAVYVVSALAMGIYLAIRPDLYRDGLIALTPPVHRALVRDLLAELGATLRNWIVGQLLGMLVLGLLTWIGLELLGVPYALAFGVFTAAISIVPFFGTLVSTLLPSLFVLGMAGPAKALAVVGVGVGVHLVEANVVSPIIMQRRVRLPPALTLLSALVMVKLLNLIGLFVAVPVLATVFTITRRLYVHRILEGQGFRRAVRDSPFEIRLPTDGSVMVHPESEGVSVPSLLEAGGAGGLAGEERGGVGESAADLRHSG